MCRKRLSSLRCKSELIDSVPFNDSGELNNKETLPVLDHQRSTVNESYASDTEDIELYEQQNISMQPPETLHTSGDEEFNLIFSTTTHLHTK